MTSPPPFVGPCWRHADLSTVLSMLFIFRRMAWHSAKRLVQADDRAWPPLTKCAWNTCTVCVKCKRRACNDVLVCDKDLLDVIVFCCWLPELLKRGRTDEWFCGCRLEWMYAWLAEDVRSCYQRSGQAGGENSLFSSQRRTNSTRVPCTRSQSFTSRLRSNKAEDLRW